VVHRDTSVYGDDVEEFRPERWLGKEKGDMGVFNGPISTEKCPANQLILQNGFSSPLEREHVCVLERVACPGHGYVDLPGD